MIGPRSIVALRSEYEAKFTTPEDPYQRYTVLRIVGSRFGPLAVVSPTMAFSLADLIEIVEDDQPSEDFNQDEDLFEEEGTESS